MDLAYLEGSIHSKNSQTLKTPLKKNKKVEELGLVKATLEANRKTDALSEHKLSHLFFFLSISSILVRIP